MSLRVRADQPGKTSFPRVSGDEPAAVMAVRLVPRFSPRERG